MVVLVLTACPPGLRGYLTRWLLEVSPGVFVGVLSARVRTLVWAEVGEQAKEGRAVMVRASNTEQRLAFDVLRPDWPMVDLDGLMLVRRPSAAPRSVPAQPAGWSTASRRRRFGRRS